MLSCILPTAAASIITGNGLNVDDAAVPELAGTGVPNNAFGPGAVDVWLG